MHQLLFSGPKKTLSEIQNLTEQDLNKIWEWNRVVPSLDERCVHHLIEERIQNHPHLPAIFSWDGQLTYGELGRLSAKVAGQLIKLGVGPETFVPLCFEKSMWTPVAILGVLMAGGAFIMLEPSIPEQRLQTMVQQVKAKLILSSSSNVGLSSRLSGTVIEISHNSIKEFPTGTSEKSQLASTAIYASFTSGSTGVPKGAVITHAKMSSNMRHQSEVFGFTEQSRVFDFASYAFDVAVNNALGTLGNGGCLCIPAEKDRTGNISGAIQSMQVNYVNLTPTVARLIDPATVPSVKVVVLGGEPLSEQDAQRWWGKARLLNAYGPTECTPTSLINDDPTSSKSVTSIGRGIGLVTWIVDPENHEKLVSPGCTGELLLEGPLVGRGYIGEAEKTAASFIQDPKWLVKGSKDHPGRRGRLYKTGDLVQYNQDGSLTYVGRKDFQVKIHGQRVELEDIERWVSLGVPEASQVVAEIIVPKGQNEDKVLVSFLQVDRGEAEARGRPNNPELIPVTTAVKELISKHLPSYMIPACFILMKKIPMTATDKTNRKQLREIGASFSAQQLADARTGAGGPKRQPASDLEQQIQNIWAKVLGMELSMIGLDDNFFHLGGDSVTAMKVVAEARKYGLDLSVANIFSFPKLGQAISQVCLDNNTIQDVQPFATISSGQNIASIRRDILSQLDMDPSSLQDAYPCIPIQEGLISLTSKRMGDYTMQSVLELHPNICLESFRRAWAEAVHAFPIMRTKIIEHSEFGLLQVVSNAKLQWIEATGLDEYLEEDRKQTMGLGTALARFGLIKNHQGSFQWFVWTAHHATYDGWAMRLVINAVALAYQRKVFPMGVKIPAFIQYMKRQEETTIADYWQRTLDGYQSVSFPVLSLSAGEPVADTTISHSLPRPQERSLEVTTSTAVRAAWALIVGRMTDSTDVCFGITGFGRSVPLPGIEEMVAPAIATTPLRIKLEPDQKISAYLQSVQRQTTEMIAYEQTGLHRIAKFSPYAQQACKFQTLLVIQPTGKEEIDGAQDMLGKWQDIEQHRFFTTYALTIEILLSPDNVVAKANFDSRLIEPWVVQGMLNQLEVVLQQFQQSISECTLADINIITSQDVERIRKWNTEPPCAVDKCIHHMVEDRVKMQPARPAICAWDGELTYAELDRLSTNLATYLQGFDVGHETIVPLCFSKSMWTPVAILAVLKAGGAFLLLDTSLPEQRLQGIINQVNSPIVISSIDNTALSSLLATNVVPVGPDLAYICQPTKALSTTPQSSSTAMFSVFTSGSTGTPKGIVVTHSNFATGLAHQIDLFGIQQDSRVFEFASYAFDISVHNILATLVVGGCLCIPSDQDRRDNINKSIADMGVSYANVTATVSRFIEPAEVPTLKTLVLAGEAVCTEDIARWRGKARVTNVYGPAECTIASTFNPAPPNLEEATNIGFGAGTVTWIVDPNNHDRLLPIGHVGELLLEGPLLSRGYLNDAEKTAQAFIENSPWLKQIGRPGRVYKTGDLARYDQNGSLQYMGRKDAQVKISGQRVELAEIEYHIQNCMPHASRVVAELIHSEREDSQPTLAAFLQISDDPDVNIDTIDQPVKLLPIPINVEDKLVERLARYMVPSIFFVMKKLPLTPTGKMNRNELRKIGASFSPKEIKMTRAARNEAKREPSTQVERQLRKVWAHVLQIEEPTIGVDDSFFHLGGDSIAAMKVVGQARKAGISLSVADIFSHSTIGMLAQVTTLISTHTSQATQQTILIDNETKSDLIRQAQNGNFNIHPGEIEDIWPVTNFQEQWLLGGIAMRNPCNYINIHLGLAPDLSRIKQSCATTFARFSILRASFLRLGEQYWQVILRQSQVPFSTQDVTGDLDQAFKQFCAKDIKEYSPVRPPCAFTVLRSETQQVLLVIRLSHTQYDGVSLPLITQSLFDDYNDQEVTCGPKFSEFLFHASQQRAKSIAYWTDLLQGSSPTDLSSHLQVQEAHHEGIAKAIEVKLEVDVPRVAGNITSAIITSAAWALLVSHITGKQDMVYGHLVAGRNSSIEGIQTILGPCVNYVPVRVQLSRCRTPTELLSTLHSQFINIGEADTLGYTDIIKHCTDWPISSRFESVVCHQNFDQADVKFSETRNDVQWFENPDMVPAWISLTSYPRGGRLLLTLSGNTHLITEGQACSLLRGVEKILSMFGTNIDLCLESYMRSIEWSI